MPFRKRERFERSDVPVASPTRSIVAAVLLVAVAVGAYALVSTLWRRANQVGGMGNRDLRLSVRSSVAAGDPGEGTTASDHDFVTTLVLMVADDGTLVQAQLLCFDETAGTVTLANVALDTKLPLAEGTTTLAALYAEQGAAGCVAPIASAANVSVDHVIVASPDLWDQVGRLRGPEIATLLGPAADILDTITTDLSTSDLLKFAELINAAGDVDLRRIDVPANPEQLEDGRTLSVIDQTQLGLQLNMLVPVEAAPEGEGGEG